MQKVETTEAPQAVGPYSQAIVANGFVFCSGQIGLVPQTGLLVPGGVVEQAVQVLENISAVLAEANSSLQLVVSSTVYLKSMEDFAAMNGVYAQYFSGELPARVTVEVSRLPKDALVEIACVAVCSEK